jgi:hypothetical protein
VLTWPASLGNSLSPAPRERRQLRHVVEELLAEQLPEVVAHLVRQELARRPKGGAVPKRRNRLLEAEQRLQAQEAVGQPAAAATFAPALP